MNTDERKKSVIRVRWGLFVASVVALVIVIGTGVYLVQEGDRAPVPSAAPTPSRSAPNPQLGVFRGTDKEEVAEFEKWLGREVDVVVDFSTRLDWKQLSEPAQMIREWTGTPYRKVYSVGLLPEADDTATIERGAAGQYDRYFRELASRLVAAGQQDSTLRLGWEFNLKESRWATDDEQAFITYWRRVVTVMRDQPGQEFTFDWNPNNGQVAYDAVKYYPGDDFVDFVGVDAYDVSYVSDTYPYPANCDQGCRLERQKRAWDQAIYGGDRGLRFWSQFALNRGKPMSLPEWGLWERDDGHGGGENTYYLERMAEFIADPANNVAYQAYFEFNGPDGPHRLMETYPRAGDRFRELFAD